MLFSVCTDPFMPISSIRVSMVKEEKEERRKRKVLLPSEQETRWVKGLLLGRAEALNLFLWPRRGRSER